MVVHFFLHSIKEQGVNYQCVPSSNIRIFNSYIFSVSSQNIWPILYFRITMKIRWISIVVIFFAISFCNEGLARDDSVRAKQMWGDYFIFYKQRFTLKFILQNEILY